LSVVIEMITKTLYMISFTNQAQRIQKNYICKLKS